MFELATQYQQTRSRMAQVARESSGSFPYSERHLQCIWYDPAIRPAEMDTLDGQRVTVVDPGRWNLEAGPDFLDARIRVGSRERRGDVEIHIRPGDWMQHGHHTDERYGNVVAHVSYFPESIDPQMLPENAVQLALEPHLAAADGFHFESIDLTAYPYSVQPLTTPLAEEVSGWHPDDVERFLDGAGAERIRLKAEALRATIATQGADQALYSALMGALGYKHNSAAMRLLAGRVPAVELHAAVRGDALAFYAVLAVAGGLVPDNPPGAMDFRTRRFIRKLWRAWWKHGGPWAGRTIRDDVWKLNDTRPPNHPRRRIAAATALVIDNPCLGEIVQSFSRDSGQAWIRDAKSWLHVSGPIDYWRTRVVLGGNIHPRGVALLGSGRSAAIINNLLAPYIALIDPEFAEQELLEHLPPEGDNALLRQSALNLLGHDHNPALYRKGLRQQGLIQIFQDHFVG